LLEVYLQTSIRVVDQGGKLLDIPALQSVFEYLVEFIADRARAVAEHMGEGLVLPVDIRHKMFRALGQVQYGSQIDDLRGGAGDGGIELRKAL